MIKKGCGTVKGNKTQIEEKQKKFNALVRKYVVPVSNVNTGYTYAA